MVTPDTESPSDVQEPEKLPLQLEMSVDETGTCERHVTVTIPQTEVDRYFKKALDEFQPKAEVPGFRPGRAPRKLVESMFRQQMKDQVKAELLMDAISQVNEDADFSAISEPELDFEAVELPDEGPLTFEFDIEVRPEFELPEWKNLSLKRIVHEFTDEEVDERLKDILSRYGRMVAVDGPVQTGHTVVLDVVVRDGDEVINRIEGKSVPVRERLSFPDAVIENFEELIVGASVGERRETKIQISDTADNENLRGKDVDVELRVKAIKRLELPEMTPAFLDELGGFEDEDDVRSVVRTELERQLSYYQQEQIRQQITGQLLKGADWDLPKELLRRQARRELERAVLELQENGFSDEAIRAHQNEIQRNSMARTERALKEHFILERIAEEEEIDATEEDYDAAIYRLANRRDESPRRVRARLEKHGQMDALRNQIVEKKVLDLIMSHATFTDIPYDLPKEREAAVDEPLCGHEGEHEIPEAKYKDAGESLPGSPDHK